MSIPTHHLPASHSPLLQISQGAEAILFKTLFLTSSLTCILKYRPPKAYRHPTLDARLLKHRCLSEARLLIKAATLPGVVVPRVYFVDAPAGKIWMEFIDGRSVRDVLRVCLSFRGEVNEALGKRVVGLMREIGHMVGMLHKGAMVHGDLTTSNLMLRLCPEEKGTIFEGQVLGEGMEIERRREWTRQDHEELLLRGELVMIDFGLGSGNAQDEDKAVDLYVLERAFLSTHPKVERLFEEVLAGYEGSYKGARAVLKRLADVRMRGRKKSMIG